MKYLLLLCFLMPFTAFAEPSSEKDAVYECLSKPMEYSFETPVKWTNVIRTRQYVYRLPKGENSPKKQIVQVVITSQKNKKALTLNEFFEEQISLIDDPNVETGRFSNGNIESLWALYTLEFANEPMMMLSYFLIEGGEKHTVNFFINPSSIDSFHEHGPEFEEIMDSFRFEETTASFDLDKMLNKAKAFAEGRECLFAYIAAILHDKSFQCDPEAYLEAWDVRRGWTKEFRFPEDEARNFFRTHF